MVKVPTLTVKSYQQTQNSAAASVGKMFSHIPSDDSDKFRELVNFRFDFVETVSGGTLNFLKPVGNLKVFLAWAYATPELIDEMAQVESQEFLVW